MAQERLDEDGRIYKGRRLVSGDDGFPGTLVWIEWEDAEWVSLWTPKYHSQAGIDWGYQGDGAKDLALALLMDALNEEYTVDEWYLRKSRAFAAHEDFMYMKVTEFPVGEWTITQNEILEWLEERKDKVEKQLRIMELNQEFNQGIDSES